MSDSLKSPEEAGTLMETTLQVAGNSVDQRTGDSINSINGMLNTQGSPIQVNTDRPCTTQTAVVEPACNENLMEDNQNEERVEEVSQPDFRHLEGQQLDNKKSGNELEKIKEVDREIKVTVEQKEHQRSQEEAGGTLGSEETTQEDKDIKQRDDMESEQQQSVSKDPKNTTEQQQSSGQEEEEEKQTDMMENQNLTFKQKADKELEKENTERIQEDGKFSVGHNKEEDQELKDGVEKERCKDSQNEKKEKHPEEMRDKDLTSRQELERELDKESTGRNQEDTNPEEMMCKEGDGEEEKDGALGLVFPLEAERGSEEEKSEQEQNIPKKVDGEQPENQTENVKHETEKDTSEQHEKMEKEEDNEVENMEMEEKSEEDESPAEGIEQEEQEEKKHACLEATVISTMEDLQSESSAETPMDIDQTEEKMQVDDVQHSESWLNIVSVKDKDESPFEETRTELEPTNSKDQASKDLPQNLLSDGSDRTAENQTSQESKDGLTDLPVQKAVLRVQPVAEAEKKTAIPISGSPPVKIKDEPMDEEYEKALAPHAPAGRVKDEPDMNEEFTQKSSDEIKISAVFSVGGNSTPIGSSTGSTTGSVGLAHSAKASPNSSSAVPSCTPASPLCVVCSGCKKVLLKGQTAFQRKGCPQLYCSTHCLCSSTATQLVVKPKKICHYCLKEISNPKDVIIAPVDSAGAVKDFCSQKCLSAFNYKRDGANSVLATDQKSTKCSMCPKTCTMRHEVNFMGGVHKLCSDTCFNQFRAFNKLTMNCCVHCGGYCYSGDGQCPTMLIESAVKKFCSQNCVMFFKKKYTKLVPCTMCRAYRSMVEMVENTNKEGSRELFCSSACVTAHKVQTVSSSGTALECNNCKQIQVPQYHLAMSDGTIRNFCCFSCVVSFQDSFNKSNSQNQLNVAPSLSGASPAPKLVPTKPISVDSKASGVLRIPAVTKIPCAQCQRSFFRKPELLDFKGKMYAFCDKACIDEFRRTNYIMAQCVYCKIDKVVKEVKRINNVDCSFCSEGCKLLYKHDLAKRWGKQHCRSCLYCSGTSQTVVTSVFGGKKEEFCGNECLSQYTLLFCEVAKCSMCKRTRQMLESVKWLGEIKHFCNLQCLMYFCSVQGNAAAPVNLTPKTPLTQGPVPIAPVASPAAPNSMAAHTPQGGKDATPVIANVISLSSATNGQPPVMGCAALQGTIPAGVKVMGHASTQTDAVKPPSAPPPRILKNKALLCKPLNQNKGTSCKPNSSDITTQTDEAQPKVIVLPLPVPVFVPVPMQLYTQYTPVGMGLPLPVPVPMFLPTTLDSAEQIVETIQKIKEKIPDNPLEADLIMMAEMVAEDSEKEQAVSRGDQNDNFIEDFDLEALSSHLSWEEDSVSSATRGGRASECEKAPQSKQSPALTAQESHMDLEADFPVECFELLEQQSKKEKSQANTRLRPRRRGRDGFPQKKRARKREVTPASDMAGLPNISKLHKEYGIQTWKSWIRWRNSQPNLEMPKLGSRSMTLKEDLLQCSTAELSYGLCKFISEARRPNGETYSPDSIYYLCLGIQQHLFENSRMENIFADLFYAKFSQSITSILKDWKPTILPSGYVHSRVEEEYLWECKQLGAFSPSVLLNTLLFFCTKHFCFRTLAQHRRLSFAHVMRCTRTHNGAKVACLRFYPPVPKEGKSAPVPDSDGVPAKRKRGDEEQAEEDDVVLEMQENAENPLRCPVRLYEFYLSKCSATVKQRINVFYLRPERSCVPNSPLWFSSMALDDEGLDSMLTRILTVRELHLETEKSSVAFDSDNPSNSD
ncbi:zinc finger MYM-type protein 4 isoform X1 [Electrophorus electricus]|uniref:zinc finger MYM-type protein 4 isoform X1 n=1 Tax=Electrophorus electricus TaxID=8005 RepID=UPI0015D026BE|nr:zinc finger MYM-type protein 4 isoform X1 [Electrophorus electricus]